MKRLIAFNTITDNASKNKHATKDYRASCEKSAIIHTAPTKGERSDVIFDECFTLDAQIKLLVPFVSVDIFISGILDELECCYHLRLRLYCFII